MNKTNDPTPPAATGDTPPRRRPRYKNPNRSDRREVRAALRGLFLDRSAASSEELERLAEQRRAFRGLVKEAREWTRRARAGGFTDTDGKAVSRSECLARSRRAKEQAALLGKQLADLRHAVNARAPFSFFAPTRRHENGHRHRRGGGYSRAVHPCVSPLHLHGDGAGADSGASGAEEVAPAGGRVVVSRP